MAGKKLDRQVLRFLFSNLSSLLHRQVWTEKAFKRSDQAKFGEVEGRQDHGTSERWRVLSTPVSLFQSLVL